MIRKKARKMKKRNRIGPRIKDVSPWNGSGFQAAIELDEIDNRTRTGKSVQAIKRYLREYVGQGSVVTELLIGRITYKVFKLCLYEQACLKNPQNTEAVHYLPMANSLRLDLRALADLIGKSKAPDLSDYLELKDAKEGGKTNEQRK